ncbi:MAG TPA: 2-succinyl-6-hydroxy-2,4-cyclohexadiene-1-carboxylate synthase [Solirubrobacteraceae bacterium]
MAPTVVLLHGFTQTRRSWRRTVQALGGRYRALAPDLPGHGQSAHRVASFDACTAYVRALAPPRFSLAGYSMGGRVALHAALALRDRLEQLVLIGASPGLAEATERAARRAADDALADRIEAIGVEAFAREWAAQPLFAGQPERVAAAAHADRLRNTAEGLAAALRGLGTGAMDPLWDRLPELTIPVTLLVGERDEKFRAIAERMAARLPDARLTIVPGAGHAAHLERPEVVAQLVAAGVRR